MLREAAKALGLVEEAADAVLRRAIRSAAMFAASLQATRNPQIRWICLGTLTLRGRKYSNLSMFWQAAHKKQAFI